MRTTTRLMSLAAAAAVAVTLAVPAASAHAVETELPPRAERVCARIPNLQLRTDNVVARLQGDASTRGSLAWLSVQLDQARAAGRTQLATVLENRLEVRTATLAVLIQRQAGLVELAARCDDLRSQA
jgi:hypothetical protein